jgi:hypothetical protein
MKRYQIVLIGLRDYERLTAEILIDGEEIALVQQEEGDDKMVIEFYKKPKEIKVYMSEFIEVLQEAKSRLLQ